MYKTAVGIFQIKLHELSTVDEDKRSMNLLGPKTLSPPNLNEHTAFSGVKGRGLQAAWLSWRLASAISTASGAYRSCVFTADRAMGCTIRNNCMLRAAAAFPSSVGDLGARWQSRVIAID